MQTKNPLKLGSTSAPNRNPLVDPQVAREWAQWARADGKRELAGLWDDHARQLEGGRVTQRADLA